MPEYKNSFYTYKVLAAAAAVELLYLVDCWLCLYKKYNDNDITTTQRIRKQNQHKIMIGKTQHCCTIRITDLKPKFQV
ncbi:hypothetical protein EB796_024902 [Bugula neritina]|uniref:Uncharacterized protein n=1 Tax=Bugula neritina TaxID=10212 RepID=A0A7J7IS77_BUGNE|nr:hypothetical protein EB796_024902 [Bugula neritina]